MMERLMQLRADIPISIHGFCVPQIEQFLGHLFQFGHSASREYRTYRDEMGMEYSTEVMGMLFGSLL